MNNPAHREAERLAALRAYGVLDTPPEAGFEHVTSMVTRLFEVPIAAVALLDADRQWFKSVRGIDIRETSRDLALCSHVLSDDETWAVPDTTLDPHFAGHPLVIGEPFIRFYAGTPLRTPEGYVLGALCLADRQPRALGSTEQRLLRELATLVEDELLLRRVAKQPREKTLEHEQTQAALEEARRYRQSAAHPAAQSVQTAPVATGGHGMALVRDISERKQAEKLLHLRVRQQQAVAQLGTTALGGTKIELLMESMVKTVGSLLGVEICHVLERQPERGALLTRASLDDSDPGSEPQTLPDGPDFAAGYALSKGEPVTVNDARTDPRFEPVPWLQSQGAVSGLNVPIGGDGSSLPVFGVLAIYTRAHREFSGDDVYFVQSMANVLAAAIARQRAEEALRAVETRYQRIAANTPGVVYQFVRQLDGTLSIPFISESCRTLYGREPAEIQAAPWIILDSIHPDDRAGAEEKIRWAGRTLTPLHWQGRHLLPSGEVRWVRFDSQPERLEDGSVISDGIIIDVTEEERRGEALRQSVERFRLATFHSPFPNMLHTDDGEILQVNDAWTHITGYRAEELTTVEEWLRLAYATEEERAHARRCIGKFWEPSTAGSVCVARTGKNASGT